MLRLQCLEGALEGRTLEFERDRIVLGRDDDCDVCLDDNACSRHHARLEAYPGGYRVVDLDSTNGVLVNGSPIRSIDLQYGDRITLGRTLFVFLSEVPAEEEFADPLAETCIQNTITIWDAESAFGGIPSMWGPEPPRASAVEAAPARAESDAQALRRATRQIAVAYRVSKAITSTLQKDELLDLLMDNVLDHFEDVERLAIFLVRPDREGFERARSLSRREGEENDFHVSRSILDKARSEGVGILATDASMDQRFERSKSVALSDLRSFMTVPLTTPQGCLGAIHAENASAPGCFRSEDLELLTIIANQAAVALENATLFRDLQVSFYETVKSLSNALEAKDHYTRGHSDRVARYAEGIGNQLHLPRERVDRLRTAAELHDIGKIAIDEKIIGKKGKLTDEEFEIMKAHPELGVKILEPIRFLRPLLPFIRHHHERYNGQGYPDGLVGEQIPLEARILNLADAFDAMTTKRPYNTPMSFEEALDQCRREAGASFDARCVEAFGRYVSELVAREKPRPRPDAAREHCSDEVEERETESVV